MNACSWRGEATRPGRAALPCGGVLPGFYFCASSSGLVTLMPMVVRGDNGNHGSNGGDDENQSKGKVASCAGVRLGLSGVAGVGEHSNIADSGEKQQEQRPEAGRTGA